MYVAIRAASIIGVLARHVQVIVAGCAARNYWIVPLQEDGIAVHGRACRRRQSVSSTPSNRPLAEPVPGHADAAQHWRGQARAQPLRPRSASMHAARACLGVCARTCRTQARVVAGRAGLVAALRQDVCKSRGGHRQQQPHDQRPPRCGAAHHDPATPRPSTQGQQRPCRRRESLCASMRARPRGAAVLSARERSERRGARPAARLCGAGGARRTVPAAAELAAAAEFAAVLRGHGDPACARLVLAGGASAAPAISPRCRGRRVPRRGARRGTRPALQAPPLWPGHGRAAWADGAKGHHELIFPTNPGVQAIRTF